MASFAPGRKNILFYLLTFNYECAILMVEKKKEKIKEVIQNDFYYQMGIHVELVGHENF